MNKPSKTLIDVRNDMLKVWDKVNGAKPDLAKIAQQNNTAGKMLAFAAIDLKLSMYMKLKPDLTFHGVDEKKRARNDLDAPPVIPVKAAANAPTIKRGPGRPRKVAA